MARKDRVPNPPKRVCRRRSGGTRPRTRRRRSATRRILLLVAVGALVVAALALGIVLLSSRGSGDERAALEDAGCTLQSYPGLPRAPPRRS